MGRPRIKIDWEEFDKLCQLQCTQKEIASWFECTDDTIEAACIRDKHVRFSDYYAAKAGKGKIALRRLQWRAAQKGSAAILIWLGKQMLDQHDPDSHFSVTATDGINTMKVALETAHSKLASRIPKPA